MPETFATAINCMDGRVQEPVIHYMKQKYGVDYVDMLTEPGPVKILADDDHDPRIETIRTRLAVSIYNHHSTVVAIAAHHDCAGNPVDEDTQHWQLEEAVDIVRGWDEGFEVIGLWVDENWTVTEVACPKPMFPHP